MATFPLRRAFSGGQAVSADGVEQTGARGVVLLAYTAVADGAAGPGGQGVPEDTDHSPLQRVEVAHFHIVVATVHEGRVAYHLQAMPAETLDIPMVLVGIDDAATLVVAYPGPAAVDVVVVETGTGGAHVVVVEAGIAAAADGTVVVDAGIAAATVVVVVEAGIVTAAAAFEVAVEADFAAAVGVVVVEDGGNVYVFISSILCR
ncbi:hypothetical protein ElyMa_002132900 [Elysia marginata]|uniref:Uncharacterized protein n=1 Tax=Elysia marginata TaxID=1093978 RepID=A0AAV4FIU6_9GAST|nr:hypothetical protein ElyMa_002132900 [Elysia marginata]